MHEIQKWRFILHDLSIKSRTCLSEQREILIHQLIISLNLSEREREGTLYVGHRNRDRRVSRLLKNSRVIIVFDK